jgi:uncharacterized protein YkwD
VWIAIALLLSGCEDVIKYLPPLPKIEESSTPSSFPPQSEKSAEIEAAVRQRINQVRQKNGLSTLQNNEKLAQVARKYSRLMAEKKFFSHTAPDGSTLQDRVKADGIFYWMVGENLFKGTNLPQPVSASVEGWLKSPGHRANILRPVFTETGVGVWRVNNTYYITQLFLRR